MLNMKNVTFLSQMKQSKLLHLYCSSALPIMQDVLESGWGEEEVLGSVLIWKHLSLGKGQTSIRHQLTSLFCIFLPQLIALLI